jgi:hypothetical protein
MNAALHAPPLDDWHPLDDFVAAHPKLFRMSTLRWQLRHREENGLASAVVRSGNRLLISESRYSQWLASRAGQGALA